MLLPPLREPAWSINLRTALFANLDGHVSHDEAQAERFHRLEQDAVPGVAALPVHESSGVGAGSVGHFDGGRHDLTDRKGQRDRLAEPVRQPEARRGGSGESSGLVWTMGGGTGAGGMLVITKSARAVAPSADAARTVRIMLPRIGLASSVRRGIVRLSFLRTGLRN